MTRVSCQECGHTWETQKPFDELTDPKCSECGSRGIDVLDRSDDRLRTAKDRLQQIPNINADYAMEYLDTAEDDPEEMKSLLIEAGARPAHARRFTKWWFGTQTEVDLDHDRSDSPRGEAEHGAERPQSQPVDREQLIKLASQTAAQQAQQKTPSGALSEARDKVIVELGDEATETMGMAREFFRTILMEEARSNPEFRRRLLSNFGPGFLMDLAGLVEEGEEQADDGPEERGLGAAVKAMGNGGGSGMGGTAGAMLGRGPGGETGSQNPADQRVAEATEAVREQTQRDGRDDDTADSDDPEEVLEDFNELT